jgi:hypothetical protein
LPRVRSFRLRHFPRGAFCYDFTAPLATIRPEIDDPIGVLDHIEIVLDHKHGIARYDKTIQRMKQPLRVDKGKRMVDSPRIYSARPSH